MATVDPFANVLRFIAVLVPTAQPVIKSLREAVPLIERDGPALRKAFTKGKDEFQKAREGATELNNLVIQVVKKVRYANGANAPTEDDLDYAMGLLVGCKGAPDWLEDHHHMWWHSREVLG